MEFNAKFNRLFFIFCGGLLSGVIFLGITSSFSLMLYESGFKLTHISFIMLSTLVYSFRFVLSPYVKHIIQNYSIKQFTVILQILIFILFSNLGVFAYYKNIVFACINVLLLSTIASTHDIICSYIKLNNFEKKELGLVGAVSNTGFRIGMLISTGVLLYLASKIGWKCSYMYCILPTVIISLISVYFLRLKEITNKEHNNKSPIKNLIQSIIKFYRMYPILLILIIVFSFKVSDSSINSTRVMLLSHLNIDKITIANISQIPGVFALIAGGFLAGIVTYKYNISKCLKYSLILQLLVCILFYYISISDSNLLKMAIILNISSLIFGFSSVMYRAFMDTISNNDININTSLASIGPLFRTIISSASLLLLEHTSWNIFYIICGLATIPGILILYQNRYQKKLSI